MALTVQGTVRTAASAGGFSLSLVLFYMTYNQSDYCQKNDKSNDSTYIVNNPSHRKVLLIVLLNLIIVNINAVVKMFLRHFLFFVAAVRLFYTYRSFEGV